MMAKVYSIRIGVSHWKTEEAFSSLLSTLEKHKDCIDQVALFTSDFHSPMPLSTAKIHCDILKDRIPRIKALGISCGLNILATLGHHPERLDEALNGDWTYATNIYGDTCLGSRCMNNRDYWEEYLRPLYRMHCEIKPDFLWIDDDVRAGHIPVGFCCFCDNCIAKFNKDYGYSFDRETLRKALNDVLSVSLRKEWLSHQTDKYVALLRFIRQVVNETDDSIILGMMTGERYFEGYDFAAWADALSDGGKYEIMWRPGGGNYTDRIFEEFIQKSSEIGRQVANLPDCVTQIHSEIESFPHRMMRKSPRFTALETLMYISSGCTGAALNIMPGMKTGEPPSVIDGHMEEIRKIVPFARKLSDTLGRNPTVGVHCGWSITSQAAVGDDFTGGYAGDIFSQWQEMYSLGIPESFDFDRACCYLLTGWAPYAFSDDQIKTMLSRSVYLDAGAVSALHDMGYGELVGFQVGETFPDDEVEVYADHPLNSGFAGHSRLCPQVFCKGESKSLIPAKDAQILCYLQDYRGNTLADCTMGIYRNRLGGMVCASGHYPMTELMDTQKCVQLKRVFRQLTGDALPVMVESYHRVRVISRACDNGFAATLLNTTPDTLCNVSVLLPDNINTIALTDESCMTIPLESVGADGRMNRFIIPSIAPYSIVLVTGR